MTAVTHCRSCNAKTLESVLDLGRTPLANALRTEGDATPEETFPLHLVRCTHCSLLQITENVPAETLFAHYVYRSSFSDAFLRHCAHLARSIAEQRTLGPDALVIDIASNDGYLLQFYKERGLPVLGIEPAANIAAIATEHGIPTRTVFFTNAEAERLAAEGKRADVLHAHNVLPHVADQRDFAAGIATLLKPGGIAVVEFAYALDTIDRTEFDQIYHEHMCYFSLTSFLRLCEQCGLTATHVERLAVHGGSLRVILMHTESATPDDTVAALLAQEQAWGVDSSEPYRTFAERARLLQTAVKTTLAALKAEGKRIVAYGASAKGCTLLHACGIDSTLVEYVVDRSTLKQGSLTPGTHLPIEPVERLLADQPDATLLLTWNFADEILEQQKEYRARGGRFIVPVPDVRVA